MPDKDVVIKKSSKLLSLDDIDQGRHETPKTVKNDNGDAPVTLSGRIREFNQENVIDLWNEFAATIRDTRGGVFALMESFQPVASDATITITVESELQRDRFKEIAISLKNFIYSHIGFHPDIQIEVVKKQDTGNKYYTPQDKLKRLIELNPALKRFQKELGLDPDYD